MQSRAYSYAHLQTSAHMLVHVYAHTYAHTFSHSSAHSNNVVLNRTKLVQAEAKAISQSTKQIAEQESRMAQVCV